MVQMKPRNPVVGVGRPQTDCLCGIIGNVQTQGRRGGGGLKTGAQPTASKTTGPQSCRRKELNPAETRGGWERLEAPNETVLISPCGTVRPEPRHTTPGLLRPELRMK